jgi:CRISPR-associated endonuclease/helicase Cas3
VYDSSLVEATVEVLGEREVWEETEFLDLSRRYFEACWGSHDQEPVDEVLAEGNFGKVESSFRLIEDGPPTRSFFVVARRTDGELRNSDETLWERYRDIQAAEDLTPADKDRRFRALRRAFYERVIQVYGPPDPDEPIQRLDAAEGTYTRETGFVGLPREEASCIF